MIKDENDKTIYRLRRVRRRSCINNLFHRTNPCQLYRDRDVAERARMILKNYGIKTDITAIVVPSQDITYLFGFGFVYKDTQLHTSIQHHHILTNYFE